MDESELIARAGTDAAAFGQLYERYVDRIYNYIYYRTGNVEDAEDLTAKVFERAMRHMPHYVDKGVPFSAWLYRIAHNLVANFHRDGSRRQVISLEDVSHWRMRQDGPEFVTALLEDKERLLAAVRRLPADRQQLLILKFLDQYSNAEIGAVMGRSEGAIKSLYHRTLLALRDELAGAPGAEAETPPSWADRVRRAISRGGKELDE